MFLSIVDNVMLMSKLGFSNIAVFPSFVQNGLPEHFGKLHLWCSILTRQFTHLLSSFFEESSFQILVLLSEK